MSKLLGNGERALQKPVFVNLKHLVARKFSLKYCKGNNESLNKFLNEKRSNFFAGFAKVALS
jgi:hypothetical protein